MDNIASMNALRDDAATASRIGKKASARRSDNQDQAASAFEGLLAGLVAPTPAPQTVPQVQSATAAPQQDAVQVTQVDAAQAPVVLQEPVAVQAPTDQTAGVQTDAKPSAVDQLALAQAKNVAGNSDAVVAANAEPGLEVEPSSQTPSAQAATSTDSVDLLAQLAALGVDEALPASVTPPSVTTNAATLSASRSNAGVVAAAKSDLAQGTASDAASPSLTQSSATVALVSNDNVAATTPNKGKIAEVDTSIKTPAQALEPVSMTNDGAGSTSLISGQEVATPANDQANRAPQLTPHTIPMLAATMVRRLESGSKQFTMRLDPPELGQVEVKLTVAADKKVRAVISADRPEALADLVRSARELTRALHEAGLDLEDQGLTFQMNDPSGGNQQDARDSQMARNEPKATNKASVSEIETTISAQPTPSSNDPFQRWQRARIALTV